MIANLNYGQLREEWRSNQRLRLGICLIVVTFMVYGLMLLEDRQQAIIDGHRELEDQIGKLEAIAGQGVWVARAETAKAVRVQLESKLFTAETRGLAQANVQTWLDSQLKKLQIADARTSVEQAVDMSGEAAIWQVTASVDGPFDYDKFTELLYAIESDPHYMTIDQLSFTTQNKPHLALRIRAYFQAHS